MASSINTTTSFVTDLQVVRERLNLDADDHELTEAMIELVNASARTMESITRRNLKERAYADVLLDSNGGVLLYLPEFPVNRTQTLTVNADSSRQFAASTDLTLWNESGNISSSNYLLDDEAGELELIDGSSWPVGAKTVKVTYTAGFDATEDEELVEAQLRILQDWWHRIGEDPLLQQGGAGPISELIIRGTDPQSDLSSRINPFSRGILDRFKKATFDR